MINAYNNFLTTEQNGLIDELFSNLDIAELTFKDEIWGNLQLIHDNESRFLPFPLTDIQQSYWIGRGAGFELGTVSCYGYIEIDCENIDPNRLEKAVQLVVERHDMLRAIFLDSGQQQVMESLPASLITQIDMSFMTEDKRDAERLKIRDAMSHQVLNAKKAPLFDIRLSLGVGGAARFYLGIDSLVCDQASLRIFIRDIVTACNDCTALPPLPSITFRDYVLSITKAKDSFLREEARGYWMDRLDTLASAPQLPLAHPFIEITSPTFLRVETSLTPDEWLFFKNKAKKISVTPSVALASAFVLTLKRWCRQDKMTLNLTLSDRKPLHPEIADIIGDFTAVILLEANVSGTPTFYELCHRLQERLMQDIENMAFSGVEVLRELSRQQGRSGEAIMPIVFTSTIGLSNLENVESGQGMGCMYTEIPPSFGKKGFTLSQTPQVALDHHLFEREGRLDINWDYCNEAFPEELVEDMFAAYIFLVKLLSSQESSWEQILIPPLPERQLVHRLKYNAFSLQEAQQQEDMLASAFIRNVARHPEHPAIIDDRMVMTYGEISKLAEAWACRLEAHGIKQGDSVIIMMPKGWEQCVASLAVSALGAFYTPVDITTPYARLQAINTSLNAKIILTNTHMSVVTDIVPILEFSYEDERCGGPLSIRYGVKALDVAYIIFTSGSTGTPKGVVIDHRGAVNTLYDVNNRFNITKDDRVLSLTAFSFDLSVYDYFGILAAGGTIVIPDADKDRDPAHWAVMMHKYNVTLWNTTPAMFQMLSAYLDYHIQEIPVSLRMAWISGDWIPLDLFDSVRRHWPNITIIGMGGATEASIWSIYYPIEKVEPSWKSIPYGMPLGNQGMHVLDTNLEPTPEWTHGEIYISGNGVALGYKNDAQKTVEYFLRHPATNEPLYRTGDLGRFHPHGYIEFLGREDQQVKVNGFRVELGEIEHALLQSPDIQMAVAISPFAKGDPSAARILVAYVIPNTDSESKLFLPPRHQAKNSEAVWNGILKKYDEMRHIGLGMYDCAWTDTWFEKLATLSFSFMNAALNELNVILENETAEPIEVIMSQCRIAPRFRKIFIHWCNYLTSAGWLEKNEIGYRRIAAGADYDTCRALLVDIRLYAKTDKALSRIVDFYEQCGNSHLELLKGDRDPLELLFPTEEWSLSHSLYENQPIARYLNTLVAEITATAISLYVRQGVKILELGAGTGATTIAVLDALRREGLEEGLEYTFTDISQVFFTKAKERFESYTPLNTKFLDINNYFSAQGFDAASHDIIIAVNVLHDAVDLRAALSEIYEVLVPGGLLIIVEGFASHPVLSISFIERLSAFADERKYSDSPFLSAEEWQEWLVDAGFIACEVLPHEKHDARAWGQGVIVARCANGFGNLDLKKAQDFVAQYTPEYMVPSIIQVLSRMPLTANGKVDRKVLANRVQSISANTSKKFINPTGEIASMLADIWREGLALKEVSANDSLFALGGDSLFAVQMNNRISNVFEISIPLMDILKNPTISAIAVLIEKALYADLNSSEMLDD